MLIFETGLINNCRRYVATDSDACRILSPGLVAGIKVHLSPDNFRGSGIDFHQLVPGRDLWIGGIKIPHSKGSLGHSDADVLLHAICDALLGALGQSDIGVHFPDTDSAFKDIDSKILLAKCYDIIQQQGYSIVNIDTTLCLQNPKIMSYIIQMKEVIAKILQTSVDLVSIKATTTEKMGFVGREEGVVAYATVLLTNKTA